jgi:hypothetical protein
MRGSTTLARRWKEAATAAVLLALAGPAGAQTGSWADRAYISANAAYQVASATFDDTRPFPLYVETARFDADYEVKSNTAFDIGGAVRIWRGLGAGVAVTRFSDTQDVNVSATLPHPFLFRTDRNISGVAVGDREELAIHVQAVYVIPVNPKLQIVAFGGPSQFTVKQTVVTAVNFSESFPFDEAQFQTASIETEEESKTGFNVGVDVAYYFTNNFGAGGIVRFSRASVTFSSGEVDAGGVIVGGGVRVKF